MKITKIETSRYLVATGKILSDGSAWSDVCILDGSTLRVDYSRRELHVVPQFHVELGKHLPAILGLALDESLTL